MKAGNRSNDVISKTLPLSARVQKGLEITAEGRFRRKEVWGEGLTVLDGETAKLPLVKRKALAIKKILSEMPVMIKRRQQVILKIETSGLSVSNFGKALSEGREGESIRVEVGNSRNRRVVIGMIKKDGTVEPVY